MRFCFSSKPAAPVFTPPWTHTSPGERPSVTRKRASKAFSLVEVAMAIAVVAFAFITLYALIPSGLKTFRQSIDNTVGSRIAQRLINEAQQTDFPSLVANTVYPLRQFDDQGNEVTTEPDKAIYTAQMTVVPSTPLPDAGAPGTPSLATVVIHLANNPSHYPDPFAADSPLAKVTYSALIAKNQ
jgi:uncharacterized protein (TIGR02598 family)